MPKPLTDDLIDRKFGNLTAISFSHTNDKYRSYWLCKCDCGNTCTKARDDLLKGKAISCGCLNKKSVEMDNEDFKKFYDLWRIVKNNDDTPELWKSSFFKFKGDMYEIFIKSISDKSIDMNKVIENAKIGVKLEGVYSVGYSTDNSKNYKSKKSYGVWNKMMERCYKDSVKSKSYIDCYVSKEWHDFKVFDKWFVDNYYSLESGEKVHLDEDILVFKNKVYNPDNCIFVPQSINQMFQRHVTRASGTPVGVFKSGKTSYIAVTSDNLIKKKIYSQPTSSIEKASEYYTNMKRDYILRVADYYKSDIPTKLYERLITLGKTYGEIGVLI